MKYILLLEDDEALRRGIDLLRYKRGDTGPHRLFAAENLEKIPAGPVVRQGCYGAALCAVFPGAAGAHPAPGGHTGPECSACGFHGSFIYFLPEGNQ